MKQTHTGAVLIGSGPSLANVDVGRLRAYPTIAFNRSFIAYEDWGFAPRYYACIDHIALEDNVSDINKLAEAGQVEQLFLRNSAEKLGVHQSHNIRLIGLNDTLNFSTDLESLGMFNTVSAVSIQILASLGYQRILLLGVDAVYRTRQSAETMDKPYHLRAVKNDDLNHFRADYYGKNRRFTRHNIEKQLQGWQALATALPDHIQIKNATEGSALHVFPKITFEAGLDWVNQGDQT